MEKDKFLKINNKVLKFILDLNEEEIDKLLSGEVKLQFGEKVKAPKVSTKSVGVAEKILKELGEVKTLEEAKKILNKKTVTKPVLKSIGEKENIGFLSKDRKDEMIDKIVEGTIGIKLRKEGLGK